MAEQITNGAQVARAKLWEFVTSKSGIALIFLALLLVVFFVSTIGGCVQDSQIDKQIEQNQSAAQAETSRADGQTQLADGAAVERRVEDQIREKTIEPRRQSTQKRTDAARINTKQAQQKYEESKISPHLSGSDSDLLNERVCTNYAELYPSEQLAGCH